MVTVTPALLVPDLLSGSFGISHYSRLGILRKLIGGGVGTLGIRALEPVDLGGFSFVQ
jgi:hypothetical protein